MVPYSHHDPLLVFFLFHSIQTRDRKKHLKREFGVFLRIVQLKKILRKEFYRDIIGELVSLGPMEKGICSGRHHRPSTRVMDNYRLSGRGHPEERAKKNFWRWGINFISQTQNTSRTISTVHKYTTCNVLQHTVKILKRIDKYSLVYGSR